MSIFERAKRKVLNLAKTTWSEARIPGQLASLTDLSDPTARRLADVIRRTTTNELSDESKQWIEKIEAKRQEMLACTDPIINELDVDPQQFDQGKTVSGACKVSKPPKPAALLHLLIQEFQPTTALELGTNVGISSAYQAAALKTNNRGHLVTLEASPSRVRLAKNLHKSLDLDNVTYVLGYFTDTLDDVLKKLQTVDYTFIDGHHQMQPTLDYFDKIWQYTSENAVVVFDDIEWSDGMKSAWQILQQDPRMKIVVDLESVGVCITTRDPSSNNMPKVKHISFGTPV